jgi:DNA invertase Pin-like site-specific DNA recombinase
VHAKYVDAGDSAHSEFARLVRNRAADTAINLALTKHRVKLVSCRQGIDDTPSGRLLYGLMAEIAQSYLGNLALEVMQGLVRKADEAARRSGLRPAT